MKIDEIRERGRALGIAGLDDMQKADMIRAIQLAEGNRECFGNIWNFECLQLDCCWRKNCLTRNSD
jgi:hypothetical protein